MPQISLRPQELSDAQRFYDILKNPKFIYFTGNPQSVEDELEWLKFSIKNFEEGKFYDYTIIDDTGYTIGGVGVKINPFRPFIGEIGYFIDESYRGQGLTVKAVNLLEKICFDDLHLKRIEIVMQIENTASEKVAIKAGYTKDGLIKKAMKNRLDNEPHDSRLYSKIQ